MTSLSRLPQFDFDEMLLTSQVYLRNRNKTLAMNNRIAGAGNMRDFGTSVSIWDLPPKYPRDQLVFDLQAVARQLNEGNIEIAKTYIENTFIGQHETLLRKYIKVKSLYFEGEAQVKRLEKEIEALKANNADTWYSAALLESEIKKNVQDFLTT